MVEVISFDYILGKKIGCWQNWYSAKHTTNQGESLLLPYYLKKNVSNTLAFHQSVPLVPLVFSNHKSDLQNIKTN